MTVAVTWIKSSLPLSLLSPTKLCCTHSLVYCHVVLDTGANASLFHNKKLLSNLCPTRHPITVNGIGGNSITVSQVGDFGAFGEVYYSPSSIANALSERLPIQINTTKAGVHYTRQCPSIVKSVSSLATSRITMYWCRRCRSAKLSIRALSKNLGFPSDADLAKLISSGALLNSKVTAQDVRRTQDIYGPDPAVLKGKTKHVTPGVVKLDTPEPPSEPQQSLHSEPYLISVSVPLGLVFVKFLAGRTAGVLCNALT